MPLPPLELPQEGTTSAVQCSAVQTETPREMMKNVVQKVEKNKIIVCGHYFLFAPSTSANLIDDDFIGTRGEEEEED